MALLYFPEFESHSNQISEMQERYNKKYSELYFDNSIHYEKGI